MCSLKTSSGIDVEIMWTWIVFSLGCYFSWLDLILYDLAGNSAFVPWGFLSLLSVSLMMCEFVEIYEEFEIFFFYGQQAVDIKLLSSLNRDDMKKICGENCPEWISFPVYEQVRLFSFSWIQVLEECVRFRYRLVIVTD